MGSSIGFLLLLQVVLIGLNAIFASAEIAVLSINETKLERMAEQGNQKAKRLFRLTREPAKFLATIQVAITLSGFLGSAFAADNFSEPLVDLLVRLGVGIPRATLDAMSVVLITLILSYFTLVFGELVPKRIAMKKSEQLAMGISGLISSISVVFKPIVWFLSISTNLVLRLCGIDPHEAEDQVSEEEIRMLVDAGSEKGTIDLQEKEFIQNVFEFNDIFAGDIATHRTDITFLWLEDDDQVWADTIRDSRHTRYPICDESPDDIVGILNAKEYFRLEDRSRESVMAGAVRPAYFVPDTIRADALFRNMQKERNPLAVVLDEHGGLEGIITMNDLIEELVGNLGDDTPEAEDDQPKIRQLDDRTWEVLGNAELSDLEEALNMELELGDISTLTGLVFSQLRMVPADGDHDITVEALGLTIHVLRVEDHQVLRATITLPPAPAPAEEE